MPAPRRRARARCRGVAGRGDRGDVTADRRAPVGRRRGAGGGRTDRSRVGGDEGGAGRNHALAEALADECTTRLAQRTDAFAKAESVVTAPMTAKSLLQRIRDFFDLERSA